MEQATKLDGPVDRFSGTPPEPAPNRRSSKHDRYHEALYALKPGQWFIWPSPPAYWRTMVSTWIKDRCAKFDEEAARFVICRSRGGHGVVRMKAEEGEADGE